MHAVFQPVQSEQREIELHYDYLPREIRKGERKRERGPMQRAVQRSRFGIFHLDNFCTACSPVSSLETRISPDRREVDRAKSRERGRKDPIDSGDSGRDTLSVSVSRMSAPCNAETRKNPIRTIEVSEGRKEGREATLGMPVRVVLSAEEFRRFHPSSVSFKRARTRIQGATRNLSWRSFGVTEHTQIQMPTRGSDRAQASGGTILRVWTAYISHPTASEGRSLWPRNFSFSSPRLVGQDPVVSAETAH